MTDSTDEALAVDCEACQDTGHLRGERCGCGFGMRHMRDCGHPARPCPKCTVTIRRKDLSATSTCLAHFQNEPCPTCAGYISAGL